ncbi:MAG: DUF1667 domain-containing protein [Deltaproteobacteria bacterium]|nr:MAG: DUF1667 domain-containing protein [Deltaproteobacteria bacterium]
MTPPDGVQRMVCIGCPIGCQLEVEYLGGDGDAWRIAGYDCKKGKSYAAEEVTDPRRMVATTVAIEGASWRRLPVRTASPIPKDQVLALCRRLHAVRVTSPVAMGDVVLADALGTGVDVIATRSL